MKASAQRELPLAERGRGGKRANAGRKRLGPKRMPHRARPVHKKSHPVHVTLRVVHGVASLRRKVPYRLIKHAMAMGKARDGFRLVHYSVQSSHMHLIVEADDARVLSNA